QESFQKCCHLGQLPSGSSAGLLCRSGCQRHTADDGPAHPGQEDCRHHFDHVEERSEFRPQTVASASSLSLSGEAGFPIFAHSLRWWAVGFWRCSVREEYQSKRSGPACLGTESPIYTLCPLG